MLIFKGASRLCLAQESNRDVKQVSSIVFMCLAFFAVVGEARKETTMNSKKFDFKTYGQINPNEANIRLFIWKGSKAPATLKFETKTAPSIGLKPKISATANNSSSIEKNLSAALEFTNVSSRELHIENRLWFTRLKIWNDNKKIEYIGPMVSLPPPIQSDFKTLQPGQKFVTEPVILNQFYQIPDPLNGILKISFQFSTQLNSEEVTFP